MAAQHARRLMRKIGNLAIARSAGAEGKRKPTTIFCREFTQ
jgi:hypothetical protein